MFTQLNILDNSPFSFPGALHSLALVCTAGCQPKDKGSFGWGLLWIIPSFSVLGPLFLYTVLLCFNKPHPLAASLESMGNENFRVCKSELKVIFLQNFKGITPSSWSFMLLFSDQFAIFPKLSYMTCFYTLEGSLSEVLFIPGVLGFCGDMP